MTPNPLRVAIIGMGFGSRVQLPVFAAHPETRVVALCSGTLARAKAAAAEYRIEHFTDDYREAVARPDVDLVSIVTPPDLHEPITIAALRARKHVLCEKPFALSVRDARHMLAAARRAKRSGFLDHEFRYLPVRRRAKDLVDDGWLGQLQRIAIVEASPWMAASSILRFGWQSRSKSGGGVLGALGSHLIDYCRWLGGEISEVSATLQTKVRQRERVEGPRGSVDADDNFSLRLVLSGGALASIDVSATAGASFSSISIFGSKGALTIRNDEELFGLRAGRDPVRVTAPSRYPREFADKHRLMGPFYVLVSEMLESLEGRPSSVPTFEDGVRVQEVLDAARASSRSGRVVRLGSRRRAA
ncbi:MAG TPA: Gfo/Idh/MocA family oxidoreductase [Candidatus Tumulicola sp.]|nr:Gfo/Idh/MocA family oxidoreductase [Candidatus Tumulicola sp.]